MYAPVLRHTEDLRLAEETEIWSISDLDVNNCVDTVKRNLSFFQVYFSASYYIECSSVIRELKCCFLSYCHLHRNTVTYKRSTVAQFKCFTIFMSAESGC